jgi:hypothetical protein
VKIDDYGAAWPRTQDELVAYIEDVCDMKGVTGPDGYEASAEALWKAAAAAFNYAGHVVGATGFQASFAGLQFLKATRGIDGPFAVIDSNQLLYPQYDVEAKVAGWFEEWKPWLAETAREKLAASDHDMVHPAVLARWRELAGEAS